MFFIAYAFNGHVHAFAGQVKVVSHSSCRTSAIFKYFCPLAGVTENYFSYFSTKTYELGTQKNGLDKTVLLSTFKKCLTDGKENNNNFTLFFLLNWPYGRSVLHIYYHLDGLITVK